ncbi:U-box domain-containing protein 21-like [Zingiber officinale]|uniref:U-box domain-containing protein n=1 Tax=Zingiber officinale TaxID=94328 RepID=A0A8J5KXK1_ZINOF|nr:U-box domain-containing protein 21-like [Zingiber officinale]KAG6496857.1 hypothetical protein ZIOFF_044731 [Zingiber officinale]
MASLFQVRFLLTLRSQIEGKISNSIASAMASPKLSSRLAFSAPLPPPDLPVPAAFRCPISLDLMKDPVTLHTGITYDRHGIETWLDAGHRACPVTNQPLLSDDLVPNHALRRMIQAWCVAHRSLGMERIPTPRIPVAPAQASDLLADVTFAGRRGDRARLRESVGKIKALAKESERNRRCLAEGGAGRVLSALFGEWGDEEILSALALFLPLDQDTCRQIGSNKSLDFVVSFLKSGDFDAGLNAALVLKNLTSSLPPERIEVLARTDGLIEALVKLIEKPISPRTTKAALAAAFYLVSTHERIAARVSESGIVPLLLEILVDADRSTAEKALAVLDGALGCGRGREAARGHALAVPVLVKNMLRVSETATQFAVSALWKLCKSERQGERAAEAIKVGAFQKLLILLQVGCSAPTKEKVSELLRLLNAHRGGSECTERMDFGGLKKSF